jgi:glycosyltransferase involved in cell wall biosynthesis
VTRSLMLDLRPLQSGDAARGIGATARGLAPFFPNAGGLLWRNLPRPREAEGRKNITVPGPSKEGRLSWLADAAWSKASSARKSNALWHLLSADISVPAGGFYVLTLNDAIPWRFPELYPVGPSGRLRMALTERLVKGAQKVIVPSEVSADDARRYFSVPGERITVIPWATDPDLVVPDEGTIADVAQKLGLPRRFVVMAGGFAHNDPRKHYADAAAALRYLPDDVMLLVTGKAGPALGVFEKEIADLGVSARVRLTGFLTGTEMSALFSSATAFVFPSLWEGFGLPLLNAFALGVPAVVSDGGSLPEVAAGAALTYPAGDTEALGSQLQRLIESPLLSSELVNLGSARNSAFSWAVTAERYRQVYEGSGASA